MHKMARPDECTLAGLVIVVLALVSPVWLPFWIIGRVTERWWND